MDRSNNLLWTGIYAPAASPRLISATYISGLFGKPANWFARDRVRKTLYSRGFPAPIIRGRWLRSAVDTWLEKQGTRSQDLSKPPSGGGLSSDANSLG
jgi:hypothetical protein